MRFRIALESGRQFLSGSFQPKLAGEMEKRFEKSADNGETFKFEGAAGKTIILGPAMVIAASFELTDD